MNPKDTAQQNLQRERDERGREFQAEIRRSWARVPKCWRLRIPDGGGNTRPADELILLDDVNILAEHKRTAGDRFELSFLRKNQIQGLLSFDNTLRRNKGLVFVSFHNPEEQRDTACVFRFLDAVWFMKFQKRKYITLNELNRANWCLKLPRIDSADPLEYDLKGVNDFCKSL